MLRVFVRLLMNILYSTSFAPPPRIVVVGLIFMNVDIHFICLIMNYDTVLFKVFYCSLFVQLWHSQLTNLCYFVYCLCVMLCICHT